MTKTKALMTTNTDPDGLACYSDHAHDVTTKGSCDWCGSTDSAIVGHVLPGVKRAQLGPVAAAREVLASQTAMIVGGVLLDYFTAGHIVAVANRCSPANLAKLEAMDLVTAGTTCFKIIEKVQARRG